MDSDDEGAGDGAPALNIKEELALFLQAQKAAAAAELPEQASPASKAVLAKKEVAPKYDPVKDTALFPRVLLSQTIETVMLPSSPRVHPCLEEEAPLSPSPEKYRQEELPYNKYKIYDWDRNGDSSEEEDERPGASRAAGSSPSPKALNAVERRALLEVEDVVDGWDATEGAPAAGASVRAQQSYFKDARQSSRIEAWRLAMPEAPAEVLAVGREGSAIIWFPHPHDELGEPSIVNQWEIRRYRFDKSAREWLLKGSTLIKDSDEHGIIDRRCYVVPHLQNDSLYRFSVLSSNRRGKGLESSASNPVMVEAPLPCGWFRYYDDAAEDFFYTNIKTRQSLRRRPDLDPFFLDESIAMTFTRREVRALTELYEEETLHFGKVTAEGYRRLLLECGEVVRLLYVQRYFQEISFDGNHDFVTSYQEFMYVTALIKANKVLRARLNRPTSRFIRLLRSCCVCCRCMENCDVHSSMALLRQDPLVKKEERSQYGPWRREYSAMAKKHFFKNVKTQELRWDVPADVRFFLSESMERRLLAYFSPLDIEEFKLKFAYLDLDGSGAIEEEELQRLLASMGVRIGRSQRLALIREIDLNGNGVVEFEEFCYMMLNAQLQTGVLSAEWRKIKLFSENRQKLEELTAGLVHALFLSTYQTDEQSQEEAAAHGHDGPGRHDPLGCLPTSPAPRADALERLAGCVCIGATAATAPLRRALEAALDRHWFGSNMHQHAAGELLTTWLCPRHTHPHGPHCMCGCRRIADDGSVFQFDKADGSCLQAALDLFLA